MMKWWNRHWYQFGIIPALIALIVLISMWSSFSVLTRVGLINFIGIMLHQFEEYAFPGRMPYFMNKYMRGGDERYPLNQFSAMLVNVLIGYICYLLPVFFPNIMWLGMIAITALFGQILFSSRDSKYPFDKNEIISGESFAKKMGVI